MIDWVLTLAIVTFILVLAFVAWTKASAARHRRDGKATGPAGIGGAEDPMAGSTNAVRSPDALRKSLDEAAALPSPRARFRRPAPPAPMSR